MPEAPRTEPRRAQRVWLLACIGAFLGQCWLLRSFTTDDAWITARYAENLADGHGFVWNPGGERSEGFSNPLLVAVEALAELAGVSGVSAARALGVASGVGLMVALYRLAPPVVGRSATWIGLALTAFYPPLALWAVGGLETLPAMLVVTVGALLLAGDDGRRDEDRRRVLVAGVALAVLPWLRPEGLAIALALALAGEMPALVRDRRLAAARRAAAARLLVAAGPAIAAQALLEIARLAIYGHLLPNSVIYKIGSVGTYDVLSRFVDQAWVVLPLAGLGLVMARGRRRILAVPFGIYAAGSLGAMDSVNGFSRFLLPAWPQLALLAGLAVTVLGSRLRRLRVPATATATTVLLAVAVLSLGDPRALEGKEIVPYASCEQEARARAAAWLRAHTPATASFSISDSGLVAAQSSGRRAIDQLLLNEPLIQRTGPLPARRRAALVFARRPDVIILLSLSPARLEPRYVVDRRIALDPRFRPYRLVHVARGRGIDCRYHLFIHRRGDRA